MSTTVKDRADRAHAVAQAIARSLALNSVKSVQVRAQEVAEAAVSVVDAVDARLRET